MSAFTDRELEYLTARRPERLGRIATVGKDSTPHVVPVGWRWNRELDSIDVRGGDLSAVRSSGTSAGAGALRS
jgi:pyridoxamine 5'-phosphate oxidase family protein